MKKIITIFILLLAFIVSINENIEAKGKKQPKVLTQNDIMKKIKKSGGTQNILQEKVI